jgi:Arc/MetJ-type ribon-helix-helix transcriptional regulator
MHGDIMNVNLGAPYELIIKKIIEKEYAGNQTEVIRQALLMYERIIEEEEVTLVNKGIEMEIQAIKAGQLKTKTLEQIKKKYTQ